MSATRITDYYRIYEWRAKARRIQYICTGWFESAHFITKTCLYNFDPLKPHFYIVKLGFIGVYIIFLISAQKHRLWVFEAVLTSTHNLCYEQKYEKYFDFLSEIFQFFGDYLFSTFE